MNFKELLFRLRLIIVVPKSNLILNNSDKYNLIQRNNRHQPLSYTQKGYYLKSDEWKTVQKIWLHEKGYRCQMFPFLVLGQHKQKGDWWNNAYYGNFAIHHINNNAYKNLGIEKLDRDVIVLSKFAHEWIYHFVLSFGKKKVREQKILKFANPLQKTMNYWCLLSNKFKLILFILIITIITYEIMF